MNRFFKRTRSNKQAMNLASSVEMLRRAAIARRGLDQLEADRQRKVGLAAEFSPELRRRRLLAAVAQRRERPVQRVEVNRTSVRRMAEILRAIDQARARGMPLSAVFKVRK